MCVASLMGVLFAQADNISVQNVTMTAGQSGTINISLTNSATNYVSFQMDLSLPNGFTLNKTGNTLSNRFSSGELVIGRQSDGAYRLTATSLALNPITGTSGVLLTLSVNAPSSPASGTAIIRNILFAKSNSTSTSMSNVSFSLIAKGEQSLSLSSIPTKTYGDAAYTLPSQTEQGLTLTWSVNNTSVATVSGNTLTIIGAGTATVTATQAGNDIYYPFTKSYTLTVNKAPLTITAQSYTITYGCSLPTFSATYSGFKNNETSSVLTHQPTFSCSATSSSAPGTYAVSGAQAQNYAISYVNGTLTINAKNASNLTISSIAAQTYTGSAITPTVTVKDGTTTLTSGTDYTVAYSNNVNAGTATVTVTGKGNYTGTKTATFTIEKAPLTITAQDATMEYGGELPALEVAYNGFVNGEDASVLTAQPAISTTATSSSTPGTYAITVSGAEAQNYAISYVNGTLTIGKRTQTIALADELPLTYGDSQFELPEETEQGLELYWSSNNAQVAAVVGTTLVVRGAGTATITAEQEGDARNLPLLKDYTVTVQKAPLTVTAKSYTIEQGQPLPTFAATYEGFVNNQTERVLTAQPTFTCEAANSDVPGTYTITPAGAEAKNYEMTYVSGTLTITPQPASTVTAKSYTIKYGDPLPELEFTAEGFELDGTPELSCEATSASPVGTYEITVSKGSLKNYNVTFVSGTLTIEKAPLTVTAQDAVMTYGDDLPAFEASYEGFRNDDDASVLTAQPLLTTEATPQSGVGTYAINADGCEAQNYEMTYVSGTLTIEKAPLTVTPQDAVMTYGDDLPVFEASYEGFRNDDDASVLTAQPLLTTEATPQSGVGDYEIAAAGAEAENYEISYATGTLTIGKAMVTVTAQDYTMKQGDALPEFEATYEGFRNGDASDVLSQQPTFGCEATSASEPGTYTISVGGAEAANYEFTYVSGTLTIGVADPVTITALNYTIKYGDDMPDFEFTSEGAELTGTPQLMCEATSESPVGTYEITVTQGSVENYNVTYVSGTLTIEKAPLTITAQSYTIVQGDEFPVFEALYDGFKNGETESVLKRKPQLATFADEFSEPGDYEIIVAGARADNYEISYVNGTLTIVAPEPLTPTLIARVPNSGARLKSSNGEISVEGLADGTQVAVYTAEGMLVGSEKVADGKVVITTSLMPGTVAIVRMGNKAVKMVVR